MSRSAQSTLLAVLAVSMLTGCNYNQLQKERDALWVQNEELQDQNDRLRMANDALNGSNQSLQDQLASRPVPTIVGDTRAAANTGFSSIEGVEVDQRGGSISVRVPGDVLFSSGRVSLKSSAKSTLRQIAGVITSEYPSNTIRIEGYTDTDPIRRSKWKDNLELSLQRSAAVHRYLQSQGVSIKRMYAAGFGSADAQGSKAKSRRVEIVVVLQD